MVHTLDMEHWQLLHRAPAFPGVALDTEYALQMLVPVPKLMKMAILKGIGIKYCIIMLFNLKPTYGAKVRLGLLIAKLL